MRRGHGPLRAGNATAAGVIHCCCISCWEHSSTSPSETTRSKTSTGAMDRKRKRPGNLNPGGLDTGGGIRPQDRLSRAAGLTPIVRDPALPPAGSGSETSVASRPSFRAVCTRPGSTPSGSGSYCDAAACPDSRYAGSYTTSWGNAWRSCWLRFGWASRASSASSTASCCSGPRFAVCRRSCSP